MFHGGDVAAVVRVEQVIGIAAENLRGAFEEESFGRRDDPAHRESGIVDAILAAHQILGHQRTVGPGKHVIMQGVHFAEGGPHLSDAQLEASGYGGESDKALFEVDSLFPEADEEIGAGVGVKNRLKRHLALVHFERGRGPAGGITRRSQEIANHGDVRVENLGGGAACATQTYRRLCGRGFGGRRESRGLRDQRRRRGGNRGLRTFQGLHLRLKSANAILHSLHAGQNLRVVLRPQGKRSKTRDGNHQG